MPPDNLFPGKRPPKSANRQPGFVTSPPPAVPVGPPLQSDRPPTSGPIWTGTPDGPRISTDIFDDNDDTDLTAVKTPYLSPTVPVTASVAVDVTATDSAAVNATVLRLALHHFLIILCDLST